MAHRDERLRNAAHGPASIDEVLGGDQAVAFAYVTPAGGAVVLPLTNTGLRDREGRRVTPVSSSIGMWRKLQRIQENPKIAVAYHTREHAFTKRPEYVLLQGRASPTSLDDRNWVDNHLENWERFSGPRRVGPIGERWLRAYHWRVGLETEVERFVVWPDLKCRGKAEVHGAPLPDADPQPQRPPSRGTGPRINHVRAARRAKRLPNILLGWVGADGFPLVVPVEIVGIKNEGIVLELPAGATAPRGGRRAGFLAHSFARYTFGQHQRRHTGWLETDENGRRCLYAPHTESGYHLPKSRLLYRVGSGFVTNRGLREARRVGFVKG